MTALNAFSFYRNWKSRYEEERLSKAPPQEQLEALRKRNQRKIDELERKAREEAFAPTPSIEPPAPKVRIRRPEVDDEPDPEPLVKVPMNPPKAAPVEAPKAIIRRPEKIEKAPAITPAASSPIPNYVLPSLQLLSAPAGHARDVGLSEDQLHRNPRADHRDAAPLRRQGRGPRNHAGRDHHALRGLSRRRRARGQNQQPEARPVPRPARGEDQHPRADSRQGHGRHRDRQLVEGRGLPARTAREP